MRIYERWRELVLRDLGIRDIIDPRAPGSDGRHVEQVIVYGVRWEHMMDEADDGHLSGVYSNNFSFGDAFLFLPSCFYSILFLDLFLFFLSFILYLTSQFRHLPSSSNTREQSRQQQAV